MLYICCSVGWQRLQSTNSAIIKVQRAVPCYFLRTCECGVLFGHSGLSKRHRVSVGRRWKVLEFSIRTISDLTTILCNQVLVTHNSSVEMVNQSTRYRNVFKPNARERRKIVLCSRFRLSDVSSLQLGKARRFWFLSIVCVHASYASGCSFGRCLQWSKASQILMKKSGISGTTTI